MHGKRDKNNDEIRANVRVCYYNPSHSVVRYLLYWVKFLRLIRYMCTCLRQLKGKERHELQRVRLRYRCSKNGQSITATDKANTSKVREIIK